MKLTALYIQYSLVGPTQQSSKLEAPRGVKVVPRSRLETLNFWPRPRLGFETIAKPNASETPRGQGPLYGLETVDVCLVSG